MAVRVVTESVVLKCTLDHLFGHGLGTITGNIDVVPRLDYVASALVGLAAEFTPFFANAARFYNEIWPFCSERFRSENTPQFVLRTKRKESSLLCSPGPSFRLLFCFAQLYISDNSHMQYLLYVWLYQRNDRAERLRVAREALQQ